LTLVRSLLAVVLGFALFAMVTGLVTPYAMRTFGVAEVASFEMGFFMANLAYVVLAALAAGYLTGRVVGRFEIAHAAAVGIAIIVAAFLAMRQRGAIMPGPYELTTAGCGPISAMVGAGVAMLQRLRHAKHGKV
jgi:hypothetical protein